MKKFDSFLIRLTGSMCLILSSFGHIFAASQDAPDFMQSIGKIYVVVAVIVIIFIGLIFYLFRLDRRITELEKQRHHED